MRLLNQCTHPLRCSGEVMSSPRGEPGSKYRLKLFWCSRLGCVTEVILRYFGSYCERASEASHLESEFLDFLDARISCRSSGVRVSFERR